MIRLWPRRAHARAPSAEARQAVEDAVEIRTQSGLLAERWEHHLHTNGFAEMVETLFLKEDEK